MRYLIKSSRYNEMYMKTKSLQIIKHGTREKRKELNYLSSTREQAPNMTMELSTIIYSPGYQYNVFTNLNFTPHYGFINAKYVCELKINERIRTAVSNNHHAFFNNLIVSLTPHANPANLDKLHFSALLMCLLI